MSLEYFCNFRSFLIFLQLPAIFFIISFFFILPNKILKLRMAYLVYCEIVHVTNRKQYLSEGTAHSCAGEFCSVLFSWYGNTLESRDCMGLNSHIFTDLESWYENETDPSKWIHFILLDCSKICRSFGFPKSFHVGQILQPATLLFWFSVTALISLPQQQ